MPPSVPKPSKPSCVRPHLATLVDDFERLGQETAIVAQSCLRFHRTTYRELATLCRRFASELQRRDVVKGDRVLIWGENGAEWITAFFGCVLRGVVPVPLDAASTAEFAQRVEIEVSPKLIVGDADKIGQLTTATLAFSNFEVSLTPELGQAVEGLAVGDALQIVFTSGTTGEPKGIVHTHKNVLASLTPIEMEMGKYLKYERLVHPIRILHTLPLSHVFGQFMGLWVPPLLAAEVHYQSRLVAADLVSRIKRERISVLAAVPRVLDLLQQYLLDLFPGLNERIESARGSKAWARWWRFRDVHRRLGWKFWALVCGGASLSAASEQFWGALGWVVIQGYGMTETTALVSLNHPFHAARGTIGQVLPGREVRLGDDGEVLVRGDTISNTVWQNGALREQGDGWLATGDLAEYDEGGNLRFRGRKKDVIVTAAGLNIYPDDLEAALLKQAQVKAVSVVETVGRHGPEPMAAIVAASSNDAATAVTAANGGLAEYQKISNWLLWPEPDLPRTSTGKVLRREIVRRMQSGEVTGAAVAAGDDLNLDSLGRVELQTRIEQQYGITLDDAALQTVKTAGDVQQLVKQTAPAPAGKRGGSVEHRYPHWPWNPVMQTVRSAFLEAVAMPLVRGLAKPRVRVDNLKWPASPMLIVSNHVTSYDVPFILYALPPKVRRRVAVAMSGEMILDWRRARNQGHWFLNLAAPIEYWLVTGLFNVFPLPQYSGFRRSFTHAGEAIDRGYSVIVFPEGRRADDENTQTFKAGAGLLWNQLQTPALPVHLHGLGEIKATNGHWFRAGRVGVSIGEILPYENSRSPEESTRILERAVLDQPPV